MADPGEDAVALTVPVHLYTERYRVHRSGRDTGTRWSVRIVGTGHPRYTLQAETDTQEPVPTHATIRSSVSHATRR